MTDVAMTADQLRAKAEQLKKEADALEAKAKEEARKAKEDAARKAIELKEKAAIEDRKRHTEAIMSWLVALSRDAEGKKSHYFISEIKVDHVTKSFARLIIDGRPYTDIDFSYEHKGYNSWHPKETDRLRIAVGPYGSRKSFPQKKDGSFNYRAIAEIIFEGVVSHMVRAERDNVENGNNKLARKLLDAHGFEKDSWRCPVKGSTSKEKPIALNISFSSPVTFNQADEILSHYNAIVAIINSGEKK